MAVSAIWHHCQNTPRCPACASARSTRRGRRSPPPPSGCSPAGLRRRDDRRGRRRRQVGERTLFRYFPVKEELLFGEDEAFREALASALAARPPAEPHAAALAAATAAVIAQIAGRRAELAARTAIIEADASLRARERAKQATFEPVIADGLVARGLERDAARLLALIGVACYGLALERWLADPDPTDPGLPARALEAFEAARDVLTP